jgi:hypothetical protein
MLENLLGIRLVLLVGSSVPLPAPAGLLRALTRLEVTNDSAGTGDGFQLTVALSRSGVADYDLLQDGTLAPMTRVIVGVLFGAVPEVLIDGVVTHTQFHPGSAPGEATLSVSGHDLTTLMDLEEKNASYENQPDSVIVTQVLAGYARYGVVPDPTLTTDVPLMLERIPRQQETDLRFLQRLAQRNGYVFYLEPATFGGTTAHWGPAIRVGLPQPALSVNLGSASNVKSIDFAYDALAPVGTQGVFVEPTTKMTIPIPALPSLRVPPLAAVPATAYRTVLQRDTADKNAGTAALSALASTMDSPDAASADGELDSVRYGTALRARKLVGVRGAGLTHDGLWYVRRVTHSITLGPNAQYSQRFTLSREGTGTLTPVVRT